MPYLNLDLDYFSHPKTIRLVGLLGKDSAVLPVRLWCYVGKYHSTDGKLAGYSPQEIESIVNWWGKQGQMVEAMIKVGFMSAIPGGFEVKDWLGHQGHLKMFKERAQMAAAKRWGVSNATSNAKGGGQAIPRTVPAVPTVPTNPKHQHPARAKAQLGFRKPTAKEAEDYAKTIAFALEGSAFCDYYEARGWRYKGGVAMKDWRAAVRTWKKNRGEYGTGKSKFSGGFKKGDNTAGQVDGQKLRDAGIPE